MTRHEAKTILHACRNPGRDASDPLIAEALAFAERDSELREWFAEWQALDRVLSAKLKSAPSVPVEVLAEVRAGAAARARARSRRPLRALALAACLVLLGALATLWLIPPGTPQPSDGLAALRTDMADFLRVFPQFELETDRLAEVEKWLAANHPSVQGNIPTGLHAFPPIGCRTVEWGDREVALVCFVVDGEVVHLFMLPTGGLPDAVVTETPQYARTGRFNTSAWATGQGGVVLAMTAGDESVLRRLFELPPEV